MDYITQKVGGLHMTLFKCIIAEADALIQEQRQHVPALDFLLVGIDGTQVLCHMTPVGTTLRSAPWVKLS